jgi:hypothetical protein
MSVFVHYYIACGNGFPMKMRNLKGEWVGLNRLILNEVQILKNRVPHRLVSQEKQSTLGDDSNSDMQVFYNIVIKPLQEVVATVLSKEFNNESN